MAKSRIANWPEVVFGGGSASSRISRAVDRGELKKIGPALYTGSTDSDPKEIIARHRWEIVAHYAPNAVVSHRTAFEARPGPDGTVFMTGETSKRLDIPGLHLRVKKGAGPLAGDRPFMNGLVIASEPRLLLENLELARGRTKVRRTVTRESLEQRLETILRSRGEAALNAIRDDARELAPALSATRELALLEGIIGALLRSRPAAVLHTSAAKARAAGVPFDPERVDRFELLARSLTTISPPLRSDAISSGPVFQNLAFFDAYFSNFIEGTEFEVEVARAIVFEGAIPPRRPADAHDVLGTHRLVGDPKWLNRAVVGSGDSASFLTRLKEAHSTLMAGRPDGGPGQWKTIPNQAGGTRFVDPDLVLGTLSRGWEVTRSLRTAFQRAAMIMFVIAEVHPFNDGNGRIARAFMNAELFAAQERRILIPTVYRDDYLGGLRALSRQDEPMPFMLMLDQAQRFTNSIRWDDYPSSLSDLTAARAFVPPENGMRLLIPRTAV